MAEAKSKTKRTYVIPLRKEIQKVPNYKRTSKAVKAVRAFAMKHMKSENVKIGKYLNLELHSRGRKNPPHKVNVDMVKEEDVVKVELVGAPVEEKKEEKKGLKDKILGGRGEKKDWEKEKKKEEEVKEEEKALEKDSDKIVEKESVDKASKAEEKDLGKKAGEMTRHDKVYDKVDKASNEGKK